MAHYNDVILSTVASQITSLTIVYLTVYSGTDHRKHQSSASLALDSSVIGEFPAQRASNAENVSIWWRHHVISMRDSSSGLSARWCRYLGLLWLCEISNHFVDWTFIMQINTQLLLVIKLTINPLADIGPFGNYVVQGVVGLFQLFKKLMHSFVFTSLHEDICLYVDVSVYLCRPLFATGKIALQDLCWGPGFKPS